MSGCDRALYEIGPDKIELIHFLQNKHVRGQ